MLDLVVLSLCVDIALVSIGHGSPRIGENEFIVDTHVGDESMLSFSCILDEGFILELALGPIYSGSCFLPCLASGGVNRMSRFVIFGSAKNDKC